MDDRGQPLAGRGHVQARGEGHGPAPRAAPRTGHHRQGGKHAVAQGPVGQGGAAGQQAGQPAPAARRQGQGQGQQPAAEGQGHQPIQGQQHGLDAPHQRLGRLADGRGAGAHHEGIPQGIQERAPRHRRHQRQAQRLIRGGRVRGLRLQAEHQRLEHLKDAAPGPVLKLEGQQPDLVHSGRRRWWVRLRQGCTAGSWRSTSPQRAWKCSRPCSRRGSPARLRPSSCWSQVVGSRVTGRPASR